MFDSDVSDFASGLRMKDTEETYRMAGWQVKAIADLAKRSGRALPVVTTARLRRPRHLSLAPEPPPGG